MSEYKDINFGGEVLQLDRFDLKNLVYDNSGEFLNPRIAIIAKSGSGKSWVIRDNAKTRAELYKIMQTGGMKQDEFDTCLSNIDLENDLLEEVMNAQREFSIRSTPSFIINGDLYSGNKTTKEFRQIIDKILSQ